MKKIKILALGVLLLGSAYLTGKLLLNKDISEFLKTEIINETLFELTNEQREENNLPAFHQNTLLQLAAQNKAEDMAKRDYFSHYDPEGRRFTHFVKQAGYDYMYTGENLAVKFKTSEKVIQKWMESLTHKANILGERYSEIGVGVAEGLYKGEKAIYVVQMFGEPKIPLDIEQQLKIKKLNLYNVSKYVSSRL